MRAVVAGGTGLVGRALLARLSDLRVPTTAISRRAGEARPGLHWQVADLAHLKAAAIPPGTDTAFCALGTTLKAAGSREAFRAVDHGLVLAFARACRKAGVATFVVVSAAGADPGSRVFYSRVKGETERDLAALGFAGLVVARPSLLLGERTERRPAERAGILLARTLAPVLPRSVRAIPPEVVAGALAAAAASRPTGLHLLRNADLWRLGAGLASARPAQGQA